MQDFESTQNRPQTFIECEDDPYDMKPVIRAVMDNVNWILSRIPAEQKLVIVLAEAHDAQTHSILQEAIARAHKAQAASDPSRSFAFGYEAPHTSSPAARQFPRLGGFTLQAAEAKDHLLATMQKEHIAFRFNDAALQGRIFMNEFIPCLDPVDDLTSKHITIHTDMTGDGRGRIDAESPLAMTIRNSIIVENAERHMKEAKARIYIQECGVTHMYGNMASLYEDSLVAMFKKRGYAVLPIAPNTFDLNPSHMRTVPREVFHESILVSQMAKGEEPMDYNAVRGAVIAATGPQYFA